MAGPARTRISWWLCVAGTLAAGEASAHIDLRAPLPREQGLGLDPGSNLKMGPCGQVDNGRTDRVTVAAPGETIEVTWAETTNHRSYYRIAFDRDGDDAFPVFAGPGIGAEGIDPSGPCPVDGQVILAYDMDDRDGGLHTLRVRLPDVECEHCTLQVVQYMYDRMRPYYFQCADLALRRAPASDAGPLDAGVSSAGIQPLEPSAAPGCTSQIAPLDAGLAGSNEDDLDDDSRGVPTRDEPSAPGEASAPAATPAAATRGSRSGCAVSQGAPGASTGLLLALAASSFARARRRLRRARAL